MKTTAEKVAADDRHRHKHRRETLKKVIKHQRRKTKQWKRNSCLLARKDGDRNESEEGRNGVEKSRSGI